jgi:hypothetical protein
MLAQERGAPRGGMGEFPKIDVRFPKTDVMLPKIDTGFPKTDLDFFTIALS